MATPLERPDLPALEGPLTWPGATVISVFGPGERAFAEALAAARPGASLVEVVLRHAPGHEPRGTHLLAHPDALLAGLAALGAPSSFVVGVGAPFAIAVRARLAIWITGGNAPMALPPPLRPIARRAGLALEEARLDVARLLAAAL